MLVIQPAVVFATAAVVVAAVGQRAWRRARADGAVACAQFERLRALGGAPRIILPRDALADQKRPDGYHLPRVRDTLVRCSSAKPNPLRCFASLGAGSCVFVLLLLVVVLPWCSWWRWQWSGRRNKWRLRGAHRLPESLSPEDGREGSGEIETHQQRERAEEQWLAWRLEVVVIDRTECRGQVAELRRLSRDLWPWARPEQLRPVSPGRTLARFPTRKVPPLQLAANGIAACSCIKQRSRTGRTLQLWWIGWRERCRHV